MDVAPYIGASEVIDDKTNTVKELVAELLGTLLLVGF